VTEDASKEEKKEEKKKRKNCHDSCLGHIFLNSINTVNS